MAMLLELCSLCPVEPACERAHMLEHLGCAHAPHAGEAPTGSDFSVKGQPYRCWLLSLRDSAKPAA